MSPKQFLQVLVLKILDYFSCHTRPLFKTALMNFKIFIPLICKLLQHIYALLRFASLQYFPVALFARFYRVTDETLIAKTAVCFI